MSWILPLFKISERCRSYSGYPRNPGREKRAELYHAKMIKKRIEMEKELGEKTIHQIWKNYSMPGMQRTLK